MCAGLVIFQADSNPEKQTLAEQRVLPVQGDAAQVQDGRGGQQDVQRGPDQAEGLAVDPVLVDQLDGTKRHHQHRHQQVGERQRHDEVVGLDFPERRKRERRG